MATQTLAKILAKAERRRKQFAIDSTRRAILTGQAVRCESCGHEFASFLLNKDGHCDDCSSSNPLALPAPAVACEVAR